MNMDIFLIAGLALVVALGFAAIFFSWQGYKAARESRGNEQATRLLQQQLEGLRLQLAENISRQTQTVNQQLDQLTTQVSRRLESVSEQMVNSQKAVGDRLDNAARVVGEVQKSLGALGQASERIFEVGKDIAGLQEILSAPKIRGGLGEFFLADLLQQILPARHFELQHSFRTGHVVDAVIKLGGRMVPVDSKFPMENFRKVLDTCSDEDRQAVKRKFAADVRKHVDAVAAKYILPDEGTYDFALMYIPAENVYYETVIKDDAGENKSLTEYALARRVIPVSPNSFYAYLQAIILGLKGFEIEENARTIMENLSRLQGDFRRFRDEFDVLGRHIGNTRTKYEEVEKRLGRFQDKLVAVEEEAAPAAVLPVAAGVKPAERDL
jgi:DNA recombination protein RmuC